MVTIHHLVPGSGEGQHTGVAVNWRGIGASQGPLEGINLHHLASDIAGLADWWEGVPRPFSSSRDWMTAVPRPAMAVLSAIKSASGCAWWSFPRRGTSSSWSNPRP
jgi:hypothetical protein